jgi:hypothetical protein
MALENIINNTNIFQKLKKVADGITNLSTNALAVYGSVEGLNYMNKLGIENTTQFLTGMGLGIGIYKLNKNGFMKTFSKKVNDNIRGIKGKAMPYLRNLVLLGYLSLASLTTMNLIKDIKHDFFKEDKVSDLIIDGKNYDLERTIIFDRRTLEGKYQRTARWDNIFKYYEIKYNIEPGILAGLAMRESYGNPLQLNNRGDGGAGLFQFQPGTARYYGLNVYGDSYATGKDENHGKELLSLLKNLNYSY